MLFANSKGHMKAFDEDQKKYITNDYSGVL